MASSLLVVDDDDGIRSVLLTAPSGVGQRVQGLEAGGEPRLLHTVRGAGYVLRDG
jgi:DNA-binding response OmpR family regulator